MTFRISAVQENQVWIEGGLIDGLENAMEGEVGYEISVAGQKKRIIPAKVRLSKVDDNDSVGILFDVSGMVNIGYSVQFTPKPASDLLIFFNSRASGAYAAGDYSTAKQYYRRILEMLPGDAFASLRIRDCESQLEKQAAMMRERRNIPYYREAIRASLEMGNVESRKVAADYIEKILSMEPEDAESLKFKETLAQWNARSSTPKTVIPSILSQPAPPVSHEAVDAETGIAPAAIPPAISVPALSPPTERSNVPEGMVRVPEGDYEIGSLPGKSPFENERPKHSVHLKSFYMDRYEVTNEQYKKFCDATSHAYPEYFVQKDFPPGSAGRPVVMISWADADAYARWAGKRLPTEYEWEAAAAGAAGKTWPWGNRWASHAANTREKGEKGASEAGSHPFDISEFGVYDMAGNVSEWTQDWYQPYPGNRRAEKEYGELYKVLRGGSSLTSRDFTRSQFRARLPVAYRSLDLGFRCALSAGNSK